MDLNTACGIFLRMPSHWPVLQLVLGFGLIWSPGTESQVTESYTVLPPMDWDEHPLTDNMTAAPVTESTIDPATQGASDPLDTATPSVIPGEFDDRAVSTVLPVTAQPITVSQGCTCDLTPDYCDIGCCCDVVDCGDANLTSVFRGCAQEARSGVCIESWLMFRANVDPQLVTVTDSQFCVRRENEFLRSGSRSCSRAVSAQSCRGDSRLSPVRGSYFQRFQPPQGPPQDHHRAGMMWVVDHSQHCSDTDVVVVLEWVVLV
ncbi:hypothetical protein NFI96_008395 [Prochilodus magdalenae]|nr:hypothetical protein NFI96_008395 [Prochilodus magdalenae]